MAAADVVIQPTQPDFRYRHLSDVTSTLGGLWRRRLYTDLTLVADGRHVRCHRVVLASASPYFHSRLYNGKKESSTDRIFIQDVPRDILSDVLDFVYSGECSLNVDNAEDLLRAAVIFQMVALRDMCDFFLKDCVDSKNALRLYKMARATRSQRLETRTREVILNNFLQLKNTRLFKQLTHRELISIIHRDDLVTPNEDVICGAVLSWVNADRPKRKFVLGEILRHVRLPQVGRETLRQLVEEEEVVKEDEVSAQMIEEALSVVESATQRHEVTTPAFQPRQMTRLDDVLVMLGGVEADGAVFRSRQRVHAFNLSLRKWFPLAPLPLGCDSGATCCVKGDDIFVSGAGDTRQALVQYDSERNEWRVLAPMLVGRRGHTLVALGSHLYVLGGVTESDGSTAAFGSPRPCTAATVERYDIRNNAWKVVGALAEPVWGTSAAVFKDKIHIFGGFHGKDKPTTFVQVFDPGSKSSMVTSHLPFPVALSRAVVSNGSVYILGPSGNILTTKDCWRFTVAASIPDFKRALFGVAAYKNRLFVAGGRFGDKVHHDLLMVDVLHGTMVKMQQQLPMPVWGCGFVKVTLDRAHMVKAGSEESEY